MYALSRKWLQKSEGLLFPFACFIFAASRSARSPAETTEISAETAAAGHIVGHFAGDVIRHFSEITVTSAHSVIAAETAVTAQLTVTPPLGENLLPADVLAAPEPHPSDSDWLKWCVLRRIRAVGLLWNRASDAWLGIPNLKTKERSAAFAALLAEGAIFPVQVEGIKETLSCPVENLPTIETIGEVRKKRCEFLAPLDNLLWDRKLIRTLFDFDYKWEVYTPKAERKYGYYVLPILSGDRFVGRIELVYHKKAQQLEVLNLWYEPQIRKTKALEHDIQMALRRFSCFCQS